MMNRNLILDTDSYKTSHWLQYPPKTTGMFSYLESRGGKFPTTIFFGLQYLLKEYLSDPITKEDVQEAKQFCAAHGVPFNEKGWMHIVNKHDGYLPIRIRAVPEGTMVPTHNVLMTVESTDPEVFWVVSWLETVFVRLWYPITVATQSKAIRDVIYKALEKSADDPDAEINLKLQDFGSRAVSSRESAGVGGMSHLVNFMGSDTIEGVRFANHYYNHDMAGFSIPASEHSTMTIRGKDGEEAAFENMLDQFAKPGALLACVSDSYNIYNAVENIWARKLLKKVQDSGATLTIRPDSGHPPTMVLEILQILDRQVGTTTNSKGYKVLPDYFRVIQGDGINLDSIQEILNTIMDAGFSASNVVFGMGGALLQAGLDRDTQKFAFKCSAATIDGVDVDVFKDPITDPGKKSKKGRLDLVKENGQFKTVQGRKENSELKTVFENGKVLVEYTLEEVRKNAKR